LYHCALNGKYFYGFIQVDVTFLQPIVDETFMRTIVTDSGTDFVFARTFEDFYQQLNNAIYRVCNSSTGTGGISKLLLAEIIRRIYKKV